MTPLGTPALALASKGMCVFPCNERSKELVWSHGIVVHCIMISGGTSYGANSSR